MSREWIHIEPIPETSRVVRDDGTESVEALRAPRDGELVVRVLRKWKGTGLSPEGAIVEIVAVQETDELVVGDRLAVFDRASCGHCETCRRDHASLCPDAARILIPSFDAEFLVVPAWIARRGRVRLPQALSNGAAAVLGEYAWLLRALRLHAMANPLRILVFGEGGCIPFLGAFLEARWPDARRVLWSGRSAIGFHAEVSSKDAVLAALEEPADLVLALAAVDGDDLATILAPGGRILLAGGAAMRNPDSLWRREAVVASSEGAVSGDMDAWRKSFEAFSERWDA